MPATLEDHRWEMDPSRRAALVDMVANAHYDVTRYPGHVACITNPNGPKLLMAMLSARVPRSSVQWMRWLFGIFIVGVLPVLFLLTHRPKVCVDGEKFGKFHNDLILMHDLITQTTTTPGLLIDPTREDFACRWLVDHAELKILIVSSPVYLAPLSTVIIAVLVRISWTCTSQVYHFLIHGICLLHRLMSPKMRRIQFNGLYKPEDSEVSVSHIFQRLAQLQYMVMYWFFWMVIIIGLFCATLHEYSWGGLLLLLLWHSFFKAASVIFGGEEGLVAITSIDLQQRPLGEGDECDGLLTDVWWRLFMNDKSVFACTTAEIRCILRYFADSHHGTPVGTWPIWWHDDLLLPGKGFISEIYIKDLNVVVNRHHEDSADRTRASTAGIEHFLAEEHLTQARMNSLTQDTQASRDLEMLQGFLHEVYAALSQMYDDQEVTGETGGEHGYMGFTSATTDAPDREDSRGFIRVEESGR